MLTGGASVTKDVYSVRDDGSMGYLIGSLLNSGTLGLAHWNEVFVVDTADATAPGSTITSYQNVFRQQVPGPLPLLGAGAAFGFTRKLRRGVKAFSMA